MADDFEVSAQNAAALFTLKLHRGEGMTLLAMNWKVDRPPPDFVGFGIEYQEPGGGAFHPVTNRLSFAAPDGSVSESATPSMQAPIQKFRWVHFPWHADLPGDYQYRVTPVFMDDHDVLSYGEPQQAPIQLLRETYPGQLNVSFTRGFVASQAFVDRYSKDGPISGLLPDDADQGLTFVPTHPDATEALEWMGFEAHRTILDVLDGAIADTGAQVSVVAFDLNEPEIVDRLEHLGDRLRVVIDDSVNKDGAGHGDAGSPETAAAARLAASAGADHVKRQHLGSLQHNKMIVVDGPAGQYAVCGSTNYSWRGFFVQNNNAVVVQGASAIAPFATAFEGYFANPGNGTTAIGHSASASWTSLGLAGIDAQATFSPHSADNAVLQSIADDVGQHTTSNLLYSLAFLNQTKGPLRAAITDAVDGDELFVYGISDTALGGIALRTPDGNLAPVNPAALTKDVPEPFKSEPTGGSGIRMHHKFVVIDFDQPTARVYLGSFNFSKTADTSNGENLLLVKDRRVAVAYMIEALRIFDHYHFRVKQNAVPAGGAPFALARPPRQPGDTPWWSEDYDNRQKARDRELFA